MSVVAKVTVRTRGGHRLRAFMERSKGNVEALRAARITVGFHDPRAAALAAVHEFGKGRLPERPAFRVSLPDVRKALSSTTRGELLGSGGGGAFKLTRGGAMRIGEAGADALRAGYLRFAGSGGPPVGAHQRARKAGTAGAGKVLVGTEGPKLINHISSRVRLLY